ncbi:hypothetical protein LTR36_007488 [Oleoguttula mirabilis]|uniref:Uncharacterized protein n=1 Tax=Oleoguttula mirabilis TaxID=1507867 RepID=A0AAV9JVB3_9PEZI|nr:hypothetical protein LTR36_007488 [Oleoguttula mirabilis]
MKRRIREALSRSGDGDRATKMVMRPRNSGGITSPSAEGAASPCRLLTLRDNIYGQLLVSSDFVIDVPYYLSHTVPKRGRYQPQYPEINNSGAKSAVSAYTALAATCQQLSHEVKPCFFGRNAFATRAPAVTLPLRDADLMRIKHLVLYRYTVHAPAALDIKLHGNTVEAHVFCGQNFLAEAVLAAYPGNKAPPSPHTQQQTQGLVESAMQPVIEELKQAVKEEDTLTRRVWNS